jgi:FkbM family methyltransferase
MKNNNSILMNFNRIYSRINGGVHNLFDIWALFIRILTAIICSLFKIPALLSYDIKLSGKLAIKKLSKYEEAGKYNFNGVYLPKPPENDYVNLYAIFTSVFDTLDGYLFNNDNYSSEYIDQRDKVLHEGSYLYKKDDAGCDITVHEGDVVLDLGACMGEFSAYACKKGALVYAFEPSAKNRYWLEKTVNYNKGNIGRINICSYGAGSKNEILNFVSDESNPGASRFIPGDMSGAVQMHIVALDDWVSKENIKIDFIKADIEGFERNMLQGAVNILKTHQPVLSLCTYHLPDDPEVMKNIILSANPNYKIIQRRMKMFAYVPR